MSTVPNRSQKCWGYPAGETPLLLMVIGSTTPTMQQTFNLLKGYTVISHSKCSFPNLVQKDSPVNCLSGPISKIEPCPTQKNSVLENSLLKYLLSWWKTFNASKWCFISQPAAFLEFRKKEVYNAYSFVTLSPWKSGVLMMNKWLGEI